MKAALLLVALGIVFVSSKAHAVSPYWEVAPKWLDTLPVAFDIHSKRLPGGEVEFKIKVSDRPEQPHQIPDRIDAGVTIMNFIGNDATSGRLVRDLKPERQEKSVVFVFIVSKKELEDPGLCFSIGWESGPMNVESYFARLKNFMPESMADNK